MAEGALVVPDGVELEGKPRQLAGSSDPALGPAAAAVFDRLGIDLAAITGTGARPGPARRRSGRRISPICLDWTERRAHVGGAVGAAIWSRAVEAGWVVRQPGTRAVLVTPAGREAFAVRLGVAPE